MRTLFWFGYVLRQSLTAVILILTRQPKTFAYATLLSVPDCFCISLPKIEKAIRAASYEADDGTLHTKNPSSGYE